MVKRGIHIYTKQTAAAFNHGCDSTAENLEILSMTLSAHHALHT
jgi:hypothetical protein